MTKQENLLARLYTDAPELDKSGALLLGRVREAARETEGGRDGICSEPDPRG